MATIIRRRRLGMSSVRGIVSASRTGIEWVRSDRDLPDDDLYIRWGCTTNVPTVNVINTAEAIHQVNDKKGFRMHLMENAPHLVPRTIAGEGGEGVFLDDDMTYPLIMRPHTHSRGRNVILINSRSELIVQGRRFPDGWYASEYIPKVAEYRVAVVQGRAVWVAQKTPSNPDDIAWNVARGGRFDNVNWDSWPLKVVRVAVEAFNLSSLDFGGVDVMVSEDGEAYVIEINSAPSLTSPYRQSCMAKAFDYIINSGKERIPLVEERGGYLKFIHPAVCNRARLV